MSKYSRYEGKHQIQILKHNLFTFDISILPTRELYHNMKLEYKGKVAVAILIRSSLSQGYQKSRVSYSDLQLLAFAYIGP